MAATALCEAFHVICSANWCDIAPVHVEVVSQDRSDKIRCGVKAILRSSAGTAPTAGDCLIHLLRGVQKYSSEVVGDADTKKAVIAHLLANIDVLARARTSQAFEVLYCALRNEMTAAGQGKVFTKFANVYGTYHVHN
jgi:hypothetical protein